MEMFPNAPHGFTLRSGPPTDRAITLMKAFIAQQLGRSGDTPGPLGVSSPG